MSTVLESDCAKAIEAWPADVREVLEGLRAVFPPPIQRRKLPRAPYHREGKLTLVGGEEFPIYTRDANAWSIGFITERQIESGQRGILRVVAADGSEVEVACRVVRYREIRPGWYDAGAEFAVPIEALSDNAIEQSRQ